MPEPQDVFGVLVIAFVAIYEREVVETRRYVGVLEAPALAGGLCVVLSCAGEAAVRYGARPPLGADLDARRSGRTELPRGRAPGRSHPAQTETRAKDGTMPSRAMKHGVADLRFDRPWQAGREANIPLIWWP